MRLCSCCSKYHFYFCISSCIKKQVEIFVQIFRKYFAQKQKIASLSANTKETNFYKNGNFLYFLFLIKQPKSQPACNIALYVGISCLMAIPPGKLFKLVATTQCIFYKLPGFHKDKHLKTARPFSFLVILLRVNLQGIVFSHSQSLTLVGKHRK